MHRLDQIHDGDDVLLDLVIRNVVLHTRGRTRLLAQATDGSATVELVWFHGARRLNALLRPGRRLLAAGRVGWWRGPQLVHPEIRFLENGEEARGGFVPVYSLSESLRAARFDHRLFQETALECLAWDPPPEILPKALRDFNFPSRAARLLELHRPTDGVRASSVLRFEQALKWFPTIFRLRKRRLELIGRGTGFPVDQNRLREAMASLPYSLHEDQQAAVEVLVAAIGRSDQLHALLQGDVGSGKTLVCLLAALGVLDAGAQVAVMCPTEVLARQHLVTFRRILTPLGHPVMGLLGGMPREERDQVLARLAHGRSAVAVGTHALLSADVGFRQLGLVVVDEQHRFGVGQRQALVAKGNHPHLVVASATPIPRSLQLAAYGDLTPVEMRTRPKGRLCTITRIVPPPRRDAMVTWLEGRLGEGARLFWVVPRVEESGDGVASAEGTARSLTPILGQHGIGLLHGGLDTNAQHDALDHFRQGRTRVLVCTSVVEVGVDVPDANLMVIDHADRFGLAQLHQLRGRVGRGGGQGMCFLLAGSDSSLPRLRAFCQAPDGFAIAEIDLEERGAGDLEGADQSGGPLGRSGLLREHTGLLHRWCADCDRLLSGELHFQDDERRGLEESADDEQPDRTPAG